MVLKEMRKKHLRSVLWNKVLSDLVSILAGDYLNDCFGLITRYLSVWTL